MTKRYRYDVFISYSHRDGKWVVGWLLPRLEDAGLRVCIDFRDFDVGVPNLVNMERAIEQSRKTLLVLTPNWVASEWTNFEALLVQTDDPIGLRRRMLPLMLERCEPTRRVSIFTYADFTRPDQWEGQLKRIIDAINDKVSLPQAVAVSGTTLIPLPPAPFLAHPYPMPENWTGRQAEMNQLDAWLKDDGAPMCCLVAIGGMGKSSLAWAWLQRRVVPEQEALGLSGIFQWSFYEGEVSFQRFLEDLSAYLGVPDVSDPVTVLTQHLFRQRVLLVLDGFERLLCAYAAADEALQPERTAEELEPGERRCIEWPIARFLRSLVAGVASKVLLISRLVPEELDGRSGWRFMELTGLDPADAVAYLRTSGVKGTDRELRDAAAVYGFHPLSLSKLVEVLHYDIHQPDDVRQAPRYDVTVDLKARQHHILERAYEVLPPELGQFLSALAALRGKATMEVARFLAGDWSDAELSANLRRLEEDRWVLRNREQQILDFHPVVRRYAYGRLEGKEDIHARLAEYFRPLANKVDTQRVESVAALAPVIEFYHHTVRARRYDEAVQLLRDRLVPDPLHFRFGAYQTMIELKRALFPDGEGRPLRLKNESDQAWTLNALAISYSLSGQPRRAVPVFQIAIELAEKLKSERSVATGLGNLATQQTILGDLAAAERNLQRRIELCREIGDEYGEAIGHQHLGLLLAYRGEVANSANVFDSGMKIFIKREAINVRANRQGQGVIWAYRSIGALLMGNAKAALDAARKARELADVQAYERDVIRAEWLLGAGLVALTSPPPADAGTLSPLLRDGRGERDRRRGEGLLTEAEAHLTEALTRCRRINLVELELDILLAWARWHHAKGNKQQAREHTEEALSIADRCEYWLKQADIHNFLAQLVLEEGDREAAKAHAITAYERAWCDGPPHCYKPALEEAERLLKRLGVPPPRQAC